MYIRTLVVIAYQKHSFLTIAYTKLRKTLYKISRLRSLPLLFLILLGYQCLMVSCFEETFTLETNVQLEFSMDTLRFDTVFTTVGSATRFVTVFNPTEENIIIPSIELAGLSGEMFRMNVDGVSGRKIEDVRILARDSVYIFVEVTIDPDQPVSASPFIVHEQIKIGTGESQQQVIHLEAWGQNANYFPSRNSAGQIIGLSCNNNNIEWDDPKPYVIFGLLFIDSCELRIAPGTQIYVHGGLARIDELIFNDGGLFFLSEGRLVARGEEGNEISFQGDRLEQGFDDVPGQWAGLRFLPGSTGNVLEHVTIRNSIVGARVDSAAQLTVQSTEISNTSNIGIIGLQSNISIDNSLIHSTAGQSVLFASGGNYSLRHVTLANYENQSAALYLDNFVCLDPDCEQVLVIPLQVEIVNSILAGSNDDEINFRDATEGQEPDLFAVNFNHVFLRIQDQKNVFDLASNCEICIEDTGDPVFRDETVDNYQLDSMSLALGQGIFLEDLPFDLDGRARDMQNPDLGCFELE